MNSFPPIDLPIFEVNVPFSCEKVLIDYLDQHNIFSRIAWRTGRGICYDVYISEEDCVVMKLVLPIECSVTKLVIPGSISCTPEDNPEHF